MTREEDGVVCEEHGWEMNIYMVYVRFGPNFYDQCNQVQSGLLIKLHFGPYIYN